MQNSIRKSSNRFVAKRLRKDAGQNAPRVVSFDVIMGSGSGTVSTDAKPDMVVRRRRNKMIQSEALAKILQLSLIHI